MKKILSILLAALMVVGLVPALLVGAATDTASKSTAITQAKNGRVYHYYESFDTDTTVQGAAKVLNALGWKVPDSRVSNHNANVTATETGDNAQYMFEVKNGKLYLRNRGSADEYVFVCTDELLSGVINGPYPIEYTVIYLASSKGTTGEKASAQANSFGLMYNATDASTTFGLCEIRLSGWGRNTATTGYLDAGDVSNSIVPETSLTAYRVDNDVNSTLYERICGNVDRLGAGNVASVLDSRTLVDVEMHVRMEFDGELGPRIYVNDVLVSDPHSISSESAAATAKSNYDRLVAAGGYNLGFRVNPGVDCVVDEISVYTDRAVGEGALYITEIATLPENESAPYIEIYNGTGADVNLADYALGYITVAADGTEATNTVALGQFIGQSLPLDEGVTFDNLSADAAVLAAGETLVIFLVDTDADVSDLVVTENGVSMKGFRDEYGLADSARVLAVLCTEENGFNVRPYERRVFFVGAAKADWSAVTVESLSENDAVESVAALTPSVAFGQAFEMGECDPENVGRDGDILPGYSAHYVYGIDAVSTKNGTLIARNTAIADTASVGALIDIQASYFQKLADVRAGKINSDGALAITEMIPTTDWNDAFECFEVTNISYKTVNLYDYGIVSSDEGTLNWTHATTFDLYPDGSITNPANKGYDYLLQPGQSVVIWNMTENAEGERLSDFRTYYGLAASVPVVIAVSYGEDAVTLAGEGTVSYGIAAKNDINDYLNGKTSAVAKVVSDVTVPVAALYYDLSVYAYALDELDPTVFDMLVANRTPGFELQAEYLEEGDSLYGYLAVTEPDDENGLVCNHYEPYGEEDVVTEAGYYVVLKDPYAVVYGSRQITALPADYAIEFSYGATAGNSSTTGTMKLMNVTGYLYDYSERYGLMPWLDAVSNPVVTTDIAEGGASVDNTLGTIRSYQMEFFFLYDYYQVIYLDGNGATDAVVTMSAENCGNVYALLGSEFETWLVNDLLYNAGEIVALNGQTVIKPGHLGTSSAINANGTPNGAAPTETATDAENTALTVNMNPNSIDPADASSISILAVVAVILGSVAILTLGCFLVYRKKKSANQ